MHPSIKLSTPEGMREASTKIVELHEDTRDSLRIRLWIALRGRSVEESENQIPFKVLSDIRARASCSTIGPEVAAWYRQDVAALLDELDRLRYILDGKR